MTRAHRSSNSVPERQRNRPTDRPSARTRSLCTMTRAHRSSNSVPSLCCSSFCLTRHANSRSGYAVSSRQCFYSQTHNTSSTTITATTTIDIGMNQEVGQPEAEGPKNEDKGQQLGCFHQLWGLGELTAVSGVEPWLKTNLVLLVSENAFGGRKIHYFHFCQSVGRSTCQPASLSACLSD